VKKIIKNKLYSTETACSCGSASYGAPGDFDFWEEELFRKRTGEFFLYGSGGARTRYANNTGNNCWSAGSDIIPLTLEAAREWAERHLSPEKYQEIFEIDSDDLDQKTIITSNISAVSAKMLKILAQESGEPQSMIIDRLIAAEYARTKK